MTKDFCEWVASLGGESNNIEESTIRSLFASGYETKPALSVPIHVVDLASVPPELRVAAAIPHLPPGPQTLEEVELQKEVCQFSVTMPIQIDRLQDLLSSELPLKQDLSTLCICRCLI